MILGVFRRWYEVGATFGASLGLSIGYYSKIQEVRLIGPIVLGLIAGFWVGAFIDVWLAIHWQHQQRQS